MTLDLLVIGLAIALEPLPVSAHILLLASERGTRKGLGFLVGWVVTVVLVVVATLALTGGKPPHPRSVPSTASLVARILLGAFLLAFAWHKRNQRGRPPAEPKWMGRLDRLNFGTAIALGFFLQPWALVAAGAATVTGADLSHPATAFTLVGFCLLASSTYLAMQGYVIRSPERARARLDGLNGWIGAHRDRVVIVLSAVVGLWLIGASTYHLAG